MAVTLLKRQTGRAHVTSIAEATDAVTIRAIERSTSGGALLWNDANVTTITIGGGAAQLGITIGKAGQTVTIPGNLDVQGTTTTLSTTNLVVSDNLMLLNDGGSGADSGIAFERGGTGDDAVILWEESNTRFELGLFDTAGGTTTPASISAFRDMKLSDLLLAGTAITADGALTVTATGANDLNLSAQGTSYNFSAAGTALATTAQDVIGAINEVNTAAAGTPTLTAVLGEDNLTGALPIIISDAAGGLVSSAGAAPTNPGIELDIIAGGGNTTGAGGALTLASGQGGATGTGGAITVTTGAGGATSGNSGALALDTGAVTSGTSGTVSIGATNASALNLSRTGVATTVSGTLTVTQVADFDAGVTVAAAQAITGDGTLTITNTGAMTVGDGNTTTLTLSQNGQTTAIAGGATVGQTLTVTGVADFDAGVTLAAGQAMTGDGAMTITNTGVLTIGNGSSTTVNVSQSGQTTAVGGVLTVGQTSTFTGLADFDAGMSLAASQAITGDAAMSVIATGGTNDLTLGARGTTITLNQSGDTALSGFTATSIVGALNELQVGIGASNEVVVSLTNNTGSTLTEGSIVYHTTTDGEVADSVATADNGIARPLGFVKSDILTAASGDIVVSGLATVQLVTGLTTAPGDELFLSLTAGQCTNDISGFSAGNVVQSVGYISDDTAYAGSEQVEAVVQWGSRSVL